MSAILDRVLTSDFAPKPMVNTGMRDADTASITSCCVAALPGPVSLWLASTPSVNTSNVGLSAVKSISRPKRIESYKAVAPLALTLFNEVSTCFGVFPFKGLGCVSKSTTWMRVLEGRPDKNFFVALRAAFIWPRMEPEESKSRTISAGVFIRSTDTRVPFWPASATSIFFISGTTRVRSVPSIAMFRTAFFWSALAERIFILPDCPLAKASFRDFGHSTKVIFPG